MPITAAVKKLILSNAAVDKLRKVAKKEGLRTLREDGILKVIRGIATMEEVLRRTQE
ncbi:hypothetical protein HY792_00905 [Candidatus Desantisbacteria bacterium]|nr:hypothetical protein [Candidatus Desantisbacteria bacterium]